MMVYADTSALLKRYVDESGSREATALLDAAARVATSVVTRAEASAAFAKVLKTRAMDPGDCAGARLRFRRDWFSLTRIAMTESLAERADALAWEYRLRGYDAVQLASAEVWRAAAASDVVLATFDRELWEAARNAGFDVWPKKLAG